MQSHLDFVEMFSVLSRMFPRRNVCVFVCLRCGMTPSEKLEKHCKGWSNPSPNTQIIRWVTNVTKEVYCRSWNEFPKGDWITSRKPQCSHLVHLAEFHGKERAATIIWNNAFCPLKVLQKQKWSSRVGSADNPGNDQITVDNSISLCGLT